MGNIKCVICYGETKEKIKAFVDTLNIPCYVLDNLKESTEKAFSLAESGDVVLLSPACASWDQYKCFEDRGNEFKNIVLNLK